jgi:hypothetical protein
MEHMVRTVATIALITVIITLVMLCLVYVYLVADRVGWDNTVNSVSVMVPYCKKHKVDGSIL